MLSRCCFHHFVENLILFKNDIQHFYIGQILFDKIKSWSAVGGEVVGRNLFGARSDKRKKQLVPNDKVSTSILCQMRVT